MTISVGDVLRLSIAGNVLSASQNGSVLEAFTDTVYNSSIVSGAPGFGGSAGPAIADFANFLGLQARIRLRLQRLIPLQAHMRPLKTFKFLRQLPVV